MAVWHMRCSCSSVLNLHMLLVLHLLLLLVAPQCADADALLWQVCQLLADSRVPESLSWLERRVLGIVLVRVCKQAAMAPQPTFPAPRISPWQKCLQVHDRVQVPRTTSQLTDATSWQVPSHPWHWRDCQVNHPCSK